jgi:hypothetical protein
VPAAAHVEGYMRAATFRNVVGKKPVFRKDVRNSARRINETIKDNLSGVLRLGVPQQLDPTAANRLGLKLDVEYVLCTDIDELKRIALAE